MINVIVGIGVFLATITIKVVALGGPTLVANNSKQLRRVVSRFHVRSWTSVDYSVASVPETLPPFVYRTLTFIVIQVNTRAPCCGNSRNPSVAGSSHVTCFSRVCSSASFIFSRPFAFFPPFSSSHYPFPSVDRREHFVRGKRKRKGGCYDITVIEASEEVNPL